MLIDDIIRSQRDFQKLCEVNVDTIIADEINQLSEMYLFKAIEEVVELRKTFPSALNKWAKNQGEENRKEILFELADTLLFLINFGIVRRIAPEEIAQAIREVQEVNFHKLKGKKLAVLNDAILRTPHTRVGLGGGNYMPSIIFIGQNPGESLPEDKNCWDNAPKKSAVGFLKKALELTPYDINDVYFTNLVKEVTPNNEEPTNLQVQYWLPFLETELGIVTKGGSPRIVAMGAGVAKMLTQNGVNIPYDVVYHPSYAMRRKWTVREYAEHIMTKLGGQLKNVEPP